MRFTLIDRITSLESGKSISAIKNLSLAEEYLVDHFPGFPVMPGVLMLETMVQAASWVMREEKNFAFSLILLKQAKAIKFSNFVSPGRTLVVNAEVTKWENDLCSFKAEGSMDGQQAVTARLTLQQFNQVDEDPVFADSDAQRKLYFQGLFRQIWNPAL